MEKEFRLEKHVWNGPLSEQLSQIALDAKTRYKTSHSLSNQINLYTMTTIHQGVRQEDDWFSTSRPTRRTRTRSIAIKQNPRSSRHYEDSEVDVSQSTRMYDMATWQMYNRIIDYRQRNPLSSNYHQDSAEASIISKSNDESTSEPKTAKKVEILDTFEGEVFQLDL